MQPEPTSADTSTVEATTDEEAAVELAARLRSIEALPLDQRAVAFGAVHDELRTALEGPGGPDDSSGGR